MAAPEKGKGMLAMLIGSAKPAKGAEAEVEDPAAADEDVATACRAFVKAPSRSTLAALLDLAGVEHELGGEAED